VQPPEQQPRCGARCYLSLGWFSMHIHWGCSTLHQLCTSKTSTTCNVRHILQIQTCRRSWAKAASTGHRCPLCGCSYGVGVYRYVTSSQPVETHSIVYSGHGSCCNLDAGVNFFGGTAAAAAAVAATPVAASFQCLIRAVLRLRPSSVGTVACGLREGRCTSTYDCTAVMSLSSPIVRSLSPFPAKGDVGARDGGQHCGEAGAAHAVKSACPHSWHAQKGLPLASRQTSRGRDHRSNS